MGRIDKTEDKVNKVFREYQDNWNKYGESIEKDAANVKVSGLVSFTPRPQLREGRRSGGYSSLYFTFETSMVQSIS